MNYSSLCYVVSELSRINMSFTPLSFSQRFLSCLHLNTGPDVGQTISSSRSFRFRPFFCIKSKYVITPTLDNQRAPSKLETVVDTCNSFCIAISMYIFSSSLTRLLLASSSRYEPIVFLHTSYSLAILTI